MTKADLTKELTENLKISLTPTQNGEMTLEQLQLIHKGATLPAEVTSLKTKLETAENDKAKLEETVTELNERLAEAEAGGRGKNKPLPTFKVEKDTYRLKIPNSSVMIKGEKKPVNAQTLKDDPELLAHLVKIKAGCLELVTNSK
jgi:chromosome segregation ATPase